MEKMRAMVLSECAKIETNPLKSINIDKHQIERPNEIFPFLICLETNF